MQKFTIQIPDSDIKDLQLRLSMARWPSEGIDASWEKGVPVKYLKTITDYWLTKFDWRKEEAILNKFPQFISEIDGQNIHYIHIKSTKPNAIPLMLIHGWPGSFIDFINIIEPLTAPVSDDQIAFDLVIPSIPGFGFSVPVKERGWNMIRIANAFKELMRKLGYDKFAVHGGDMGAGITGIISGIAASDLIGTHINSDFFSIAGLGMFPANDDFLTGEHKNRLGQMIHYKKDGTAYLDIQATRPNTIGIALSDSPIGQLAWIFEKYKEWSDEDKNVPEDAIHIDHLLTNVSLYWFNQLGASSAGILSENMSMAFEWGSQSSDNENQWNHPKVPSAIACFGRKEDEALLKKLISFTGVPESLTFYNNGCHFPAMEVPGLLVNDIREFYSKIINQCPEKKS